VTQAAVAVGRPCWWRTRLIMRISLALQELGPEQGTQDAAWHSAVVSDEWMPCAALVASVFLLSSTVCNCRQLKSILALYVCRSIEHNKVK
jgi:hypothetical protein